MDNNNNNNNNNNNCNNNIDNSVIFFKIFRNVFIKNKIFNYVNLYNNHFYNRLFQLSNSISKNKSYSNDEDDDDDVLELTEYYYKYYLDKITLVSPIAQNLHSFIKLLHKSLPANVREVNLEYVKISYPYPEIPIDGQIVPNSVESLTLPKHFNYNIGPDKLPSNLKHLTFNSHFNRQINSISTVNNTIQSYLPPGLIYLDLGSKFNQIIYPGALPNTLKTLKLSSDFNQELLFGSLPDSLTLLEMGISFNIKLNPNVLPKNIEYLAITQNYNHCIKPDILPSNLTHLHFDLFSVFNHPIGESTIPHGVKKLSLGINFNQSLINLPSSVKVLKVPTFMNIENIKSIPSSVEKLEFSCLEHAPRQLDKDWYCGIESSLKSLKVNSMIILLSIPPNLRKLNNFKYSFEPDVYERQVKMLTQHSNIKYLILNCHSQMTLDLNDIPTQLEFLSIRNSSSQLDTPSLHHFTELKTLMVGTKIKILSNTLPNGLTTLYIESHLYHSFQSDSLPSSLLNLSIKSSAQEFLYQHAEALKRSNIRTLEIDSPSTISSDNLPPNIQVLIIWDTKAKIRLPLPSTLKSIYIYTGNTPILNDLLLFDKLSNMYKLKVMDVDALTPIFKKICKNKI